MNYQVLHLEAGSEYECLTTIVSENLIFGTKGFR